MILISGVGLILLTMTNRMGRIVDRVRNLSAEQMRIVDARQNAREAQIQILLVRARLVRTAIVLITISALIAAVMIIVLFFSAVFNFNSALVTGGLFVACMMSISASLLFFIADINRSLLALKLEVSETSKIRDAQP